MFNEICINEEMLPKYTYTYMIKMSRKVDKSNTYNGFRGKISFFIPRRTSSDSLNKERTSSSIYLSVYIYIYI